MIVVVVVVVVAEIYAEKEAAVAKMTTDERANDNESDGHCRNIVKSWRAD